MTQVTADAAKPGTAAEGVGAARSGWFTEISTLWPGQGLSFEIKEQLFQDRSKFQVRVGSGVVDGRCRGKNGWLGAAILQRALGMGSPRRWARSLVQGGFHRRW